MAPPEIAGLSPRDRHLFEPGPKRMLSLDGGGVRGAIAIGFLERLESLIEEIEGRYGDIYGLGNNSGVNDGAGL